jgi:hypothetical protein
MTVEEYEERFRRTAPSLHQQLRELRGSAGGGWARRQVWIARAAAWLTIIGLEVATSRAADHLAPLPAPAPPSAIR